MTRTSLPSPLLRHANLFLMHMHSASISHAFRIPHSPPLSLVPRPPFNGSGNETILPSATCTVYMHCNFHLIPFPSSYLPCLGWLTT